MSAPSPRLPAGQLPETGSQLSERDWAILREIASHRFLTTKQIERWHFADHASELSAARTCRRVLRRLHDLRVLAPLQRRIGGVRAGSASHVWSIGPVGDRLLQHVSGGGVRRRLREPSATFLDHGLAVAELHLALLEATRHGALQVLNVQLEPGCWRRYLGAGGQTVTLRPDLAVTTAIEKFEDVWFVEVDRATESLPTVLRKCRLYEEYRRTGTEQADGGVFPLVVWAVPHEARETKLREAIAAQRGLDTGLFRVVQQAVVVPLLQGGAA